MKNIKKFLVPLFCIISLVMSLALVSCFECNHVWGDWEAAGAPTCGGTPMERVCSECGEIETRNDGGDHTYAEWTVVKPATCTEKGVDERICSACQNKETRESAPQGHVVGQLLCERCLTMPYNAPEIDYTKWDSIGVKVTDLEMDIQDSVEPNYSGKLTADIAEAYFTLDENKQPYGFGKANITMTNSNVNNSIEAYIYVEDGIVYVAVDGKELDTDSNEDFSQYIKLELENVPELSKVFETIKYLEQEQNQETINTFAEAFPKWIEEDFLPIFADVDLLEADAEKVKEAVAFINSFYTVEKVCENTAISFNYETLKEWNNTLSSKTVTEFIDLLAGEGFAAELEALLVSDDLYSFSVADLINYIQVEKKIDLVKLLDAADKLLVILTEDETATLEKLLGASMEAEEPLPDFETLLTDEELLKMSVKDLIYMEFGAEDDPKTEEDETVTADDAVAFFKQKITETFQMFETKNLYYEIAPKHKDVILGEQAPEIDYGAQFKEDLDSVIGELENMFKVTATFDKDYNFVNIVANIKMPLGEAYNEFIFADTVITVTTEKVTISMSYDSDEQKLTESMDIIPGYKITVDSEKIAQIKEIINKAPATITAEILEGYIDFYESFRFIWAIKIDEENNLAYLIYRNNVMPVSESNDSQGNKMWKANFRIEVIYCDKIAGINVAKACKDKISASYLIAAGEGFASVSFFADASYTSGENALDSCNKDEMVNTILDSASENYSPIDISFAFLYDPASGEILQYSTGHTDDLGHSYELVEEESYNSTGCTGFGKEHYECTECDAEHDEFYVKGHDIYNTYVAVEGGYAISQKCSDCNETVYSADDIITVETELETSLYSVEEETGIAFTVEKEGTYIIYGNPENNVDTVCELYAFIFDEMVQVARNDDGYENMQFYIEVQLSPDLTYIVKPSCFSGTKSFSFAIELLEEAD